MLCCDVEPAAAAGVSFPVDRTEATAGSPRMVAIELEAPAGEDRNLEASSSDPGVLEVLEPGKILKGKTLGFVRVRGLAQGGAVLRVEDARIAVEVRPQEAGPLVRARTPRITAPPAGAVIWGTVGVGVQWTDDLGEVDPASIRLRLPDGSRLEPVEHGGPGSDGWAAFDLDTTTLSPGPVLLVAERPGLPGLPPRESEPLRVVVADAAQLTVIEGEAEAGLGEDRPLPDRLGGDRKLNVFDDADASGAKAIANHAPQPMLVVPLDVSQEGWHQAIARVRGTFSTGAFPALGFGVDAEQRPRAAGNSMGTRWHRVAVGPPVYLKPHAGGEAQGDTEERPAWLEDHQRLVSFRFVNDHALRGGGKGKNRLAGEDRNLYIDSWEIARLPDSPGLSLPATGSDAPPAADTPSRGDKADRLRVSLDPLPEATRVSGGFTVRAMTAAPGSGGAEVGPQNTLFSNGRPIAAAAGQTPVFAVPASALRPGENRFRVRARFDGAEAWSEPLRVLAPANAPADAAEVPAASHRFAVDSGRWTRPASDWSRPAVESRREGDLRHAEFKFHTNAAAELRLPEDLTGRFRAVLEGRPGWFNGSPRFRAQLVTPEETRDLGEHDLKGRTAGFGPVDLPAGPKTLRIAFVNDAYDAQTKKDRNLWLRAVRFEPPAGKDREAPAAELRWPVAGATLGGFALLVVDASDARGVTRAQPLLDGEPAGERVSVEPGRGRFLVPLLLRGVAGEHRVSVRLADAAGNETTTDEVPVRVSGPRGRRLAGAVFVLNRLGFGPEPAALADALVDGPKAWALDRLENPDVHGSAAALARAAAVEGDDFNRGVVQRRGLAWLIEAPDPLRARRVAFLDNHLTTWIQKTQPERQAKSFGDIIEGVDRPFFELLFASATSPAMLRYLDQQRSFVRRINENYAREILELHTVGVHGGYTQQDVTELASVLTGLTVANIVDNAPPEARARQAFAFVPSRHDPRAVRAFGLDLPAADRDGEGFDAAAFDRVRRVLEALAAHPATAAYLADKLADHHLGQGGSEDDGGVRDAMAAAFLRHQGRLPEVLIAMVEQPAFAEAMNRAVAEGPTAGARVARPLDAAVRLQRVTGQVEPGAAARYLNGAGFGLFDRETPDGYPDEDAAYADSNATLQRWRYASSAANRIVGTLPGALRRPGKQDLKSPEALADWRQRVVDTLAGSLTGGLLSETSNEAALSVLIRAGEHVGDAEVRTLAALVSQLPEGALR